MKETVRPLLVFAVAGLYVVMTSFVPHSTAAADAILGMLLLSGLAVIGIPHGALDVWTYQHRTKNSFSSLGYIVGYLIAIGLVFAFWMVFPAAGLTLFLVLSAWHFGQADFVLWGLHKGGWAWGTLALSLILVWHMEEALEIVSHMGVEPGTRNLISSFIPALQWTAITGWFIAAARAIYLRKAPWLWTLGMLAFTPWIPLLLAFGMYFVGQHSFAGWSHLQHEMNLRSMDLWRKAFPFTVGAWLLIAGGIWFLTSGKSSDLHATSGAFFMLLGSISIPHIFESHWLLRNDAGR